MKIVDLATSSTTIGHKKVLLGKKIRKIMCNLLKCPFLCYVGV